VIVGGLEIDPAGAACAFATVAATVSVLYWMLHPPQSKADIAAKAAESQLRRTMATTIVVFSSEIRSEHMMVLAARLARGSKTELMAVYVIEVPFTLPTQAPMEDEDRVALDTLAAAQQIAKNHGVDVRTEILHHRFTTQAVLELAKRETADLIVIGSFREGGYSGAPLGRTIEAIAASAKCDVLIGVEGKHGTLLGEEFAQAGDDANANPTPNVT
jgi:nucleotide-binding universal stress UspA family protein